MTNHEAALRGLVEQWRLMADGAQRVTSKLALNHCANQLDALLSAPAPPSLSLSPEERETWQPIESAPKDGTLVDVWLGNADPEECEFYCGSKDYRRSTGWRYQHGRFRPHVGLMLPVVTVFPTHWMLLPAPPTTKEQEQDFRVVRRNRCHL